MQFVSPRIKSGFAAASLVCAVACATTPPPKPITPEEQMQIDHQKGRELARDFQPNLKLKDDIEVAVYMRNMAEEIAAQTPELSDSPLGVFMIQDRDRHWINYGLPGNRLYISSGLLKGIEFENELAAAMALQFGHILRRHAVIRFEEVESRKSEYSTKVEYFGPGGIFTFSEKDYKEAVDSAVGIMYRSGFDARGLVSLWQKYQNNPSRSPYEASSLERLLEYTRQAVALYTPLRNPIVRSEAFLRVQKRIQRL